MSNSGTTSSIFRFLDGSRVAAAPHSAAPHSAGICLPPGPSRRRSRRGHRPSAGEQPAVLEIDLEKAEVALLSKSEARAACAALSSAADRSAALISFSRLRARATPVSPGAQIGDHALQWREGVHGTWYMQAGVHGGCTWRVCMEGDLAKSIAAITAFACSLSSVSVGILPGFHCCDSPRTPPALRSPRSQPGVSPRLLVPGEQLLSQHERPPVPRLCGREGVGASLWPDAGRDSAIV